MDVKTARLFIGSFTPEEKKQLFVKIYQDDARRSGRTWKDQRQRFQDELDVVFDEEWMSLPPDLEREADLLRSVFGKKKPTVTDFLALQVYRNVDDAVKNLEKRAPVPMKAVESPIVFVLREEGTDAAADAACVLYPDGGLCVFRGSVIAGKGSPDLPEDIRKRRQELEVEEILKDGVFEKTWKDTTLAESAAVITGRPTDGLGAWKTVRGMAAGKLLKM